MALLVPTRGCALTVLSCLLAAASVGADSYPRQPDVDILHYIFRLTVSDNSNEIQGEATIALRAANDDVRDVYLDLTSATNGRGMQVSSVTTNGRSAQFVHESNRLRVSLTSLVPPRRAVSLIVTYGGVPADGLRFVNNRYGERTAFSENFPDKSRHWLPTIDHPYDKATAEFIITAPARYQVVTNGALVEEMDLGNGQRRTHYRQSSPIASWLYALGMARFAVHHAGTVQGVPLQSWVFPQDREKGYQLFEQTTRRAIEFFSDRIGPYPYEKIANVQAAGIGGDTEHATEIFYQAAGVAAGRGAVVHEIAHQWWGNAVTQSDWDDIWLSEGFATYFTHLFREQYEGQDAFVAGLRQDRNLILSAEQKSPNTTIVHAGLSDMEQVLNLFVYYKASWVLHMLRGLLGADAFQEGIRRYYAMHRDSNVSTNDFRNAMERAAGRDLEWFFRQWIYGSGVPRIEATWQYLPGEHRLHVDIAQTQPGPLFRVPLEIGIRMDQTDALRVERVDMSDRHATFTFPVSGPPVDLVLDPETRVLIDRGPMTRRD